MGPQAASRTLFRRSRDQPETMLLYAWCIGVFGLAMYNLKRVYFNNEAGSYTNIDIRGDPFKQNEAARVGLEDPASGKHSLWWHVAKVKTDEEGANIGILWKNRMRPHQYSKPGEAGIGAGVNMDNGAGTS
eukprot:GHRR01000645.1.p1 GENE.GHRR01000645.1~~GHRR01000645.1.p1  ORF type:complete len:131 (+),score=38.13 GHRR01000645.1:351-743(+)